MGKKDNKTILLAKEFEAMISLIPKLENFIKAHHEITAGYQKYRKNGGAAIPGIEKHLGIKKQDRPVSAKTAEPKPDTAPKISKKVVTVKKNTAVKS
jgi:hypothetical protein